MTSLKVTSICAGILVVCVSADAELPPGFELVRITDDPDHDTRPKVNECGQIVYAKWINQESSEIFVYDNGETERVTWNDLNDALPDINNSGMITWTLYYSPENSWVWLLEHSVASELFPGRSSKINDRGQIGFLRFNNQGCNGADADIFLFDGGIIEQITHEDKSNQGLSINDRGELAWIRYDFCPPIWRSDVMLYSGGEINQVTTDRFQPQRVWINDSGSVAWDSLDYEGTSEKFIEIMEDGEQRIFATNAKAPKLNNRGDVGYNRDVGGPPVGLVYYEDEVYEIPFPGTIAVGSLDINDYGEVVLFLNFGYPESDLALLRRIRTGDSEFDGDIDHDDLAKLVDCMTGPGWVERTNPGPEDSLCDCRFLDINHDGSVDLRDYAMFQESFGR